MEEVRKIYQLSDPIPVDLMSPRTYHALFDSNENKYVLFIVPDDGSGLFTKSFETLSELDHVLYDFGLLSSKDMKDLGYDDVEGDEMEQTMYPYEHIVKILKEMNDYGKE